MIAGVYNFTIDQGATFSRQLTLKDASDDPMNLTGYTARMQIRPEIESDEVMVELTTTNGRIALGGVAGTVTLTISATVTATIDKEGVYDLELVTPAGEVYRALKGKVRLEPEVTR